MRCPNCDHDTFHDRGSYRHCSNCGYIGWSWWHDVTAVGRGPGRRCPICEKLTLHDIVTLPSGQIVRRCAICNYTGIEPAGEGPEDDASREDSSDETSPEGE